MLHMCKDIEDKPAQNACKNPLPGLIFPWTEIRIGLLQHSSWANADPSCQHDMFYDVNMTACHWVLSTFPLAKTIFNDPAMVIHHNVAHVVGKSALTEL